MEKGYFWTMCALFLHQIDAAFWHEWDMFWLPGGIQGYLVFNAVAIPVVLLGYRHIVTGTRKAVVYASLCSALGALTFVIHLGFALAGYEQFHLPVSILLIVLCLAGALWLAVAIYKQGQARNLA